MIEPDEEGLITCLNCGERFKPVLERKDSRPIQQQYPDAPAWQREQLISGICSEECWDSFLGFHKVGEDWAP